MKDVSHIKGKDSLLIESLSGHWLKLPLPSLPHVEWVPRTCHGVGGGDSQQSEEATFDTKVLIRVTQSSGWALDLT